MSKANVKAMGEKVATVDPREAWGAQSRIARSAVRVVLRVRLTYLEGEIDKGWMGRGWPREIRALRAALALLSEPTPKTKRPSCADQVRWDYDAIKSTRADIAGPGLAWEDLTPPQRTWILGQLTGESDRAMETAKKSLRHRTGEPWEARTEAERSRLLRSLVEHVAEPPSSPPPKRRKTPPTAP